MIVMLAIHGAHQTKVVSDAAQVRQHLRHLRAALSVVFELESAGHEDVVIPRLKSLYALRMRLSASLGQLRLGVEQIHLARSPVLHELDHSRGAGGEVPGARLQVHYLCAR